jgi:hypothetical protein
MGDPATLWRPDNTKNPSPTSPGSQIYRPDIQDFIEEKINGLDSELRSLSQEIHSVRNIIINYIFFLNHAEWGTVI